MKRHLCISAIFALVLVPDWSSACGPRWGMPAYEGGYYTPVYHAAPPVYHQPVYMQPAYVQPCIPTAPPMFPPPRVEQAKAKAGGTLTEPIRPIARPTPAPTKPPEIEPVRPAAGMSDPPVRPARPEPAPAPEPKRGGLFEIPKNLTPDNKPPSVEPPKPELKLPEPKLPDPGLPKIEAPKIDAPKLPDPTAPKNPFRIGSDPTLPPIELPGGNAVPSPAPAPDALIPSPGIPTPKNDTLPPLTLPPDTPVSPSPAPAKVTEVKSSPLGTAARELKVSVFPAAGTATANGLRKVGFYNHTNRDLSLTIEGKTVTLPAMSYLHAQLSPTFTWKCADRPATRATVPTDASGLDVLIRE